MNYISIPAIIILHISYAVMIFYIGDLPKLWNNKSYNVFIPSPYSVFNKSDAHNGITAHTVQKYLEDYYNPAVNYIRAKSDFERKLEKISEIRILISALILLFFIPIHMLIWLRFFDLPVSILATAITYGLSVLIGYIIFRIKFKVNFNGEDLDIIKKQFLHHYPEDCENRENLFNQYVISWHYGTLQESLTDIEKKYEVSKFLQLSLFIIPLIIILFT